MAAYLQSEREEGFALADTEYKAAHMLNAEAARQWATRIIASSWDRGGTRRWFAPSPREEGTTAPKNLRPHAPCASTTLNRQSPTASLLRSCFASRETAQRERERRIEGGASLATYTRIKEAQGACMCSSDVPSPHPSNGLSTRANF